ncbi:MAG: hypothetical protein ACOC8B_05380, partial [Gemmatimonadota bacterium]
LGGGVLVDAGGRLTLRGATVSGSTATGTDAAGGGGGVAVFEGTLIVLDSRVTGNTAGAGGGIYTIGLGGAEAATAIEGTTVAENSATIDGGGIATVLGSTVVRESRIVDNTAFRGGGIANHGTLLVEPDSRVSGNEATTDGGGLYNTRTATFDGAVIEGNAGAHGGGLFNQNDATLIVRANSRVTRNTTTDADPDFAVGAGIFNGFDAVATIVESRVTENRAATTGGAIYNWGELTVRESVIARNRAGSGGGLAVAAGAATITGSVVEANEAEVDRGGGILSVSGNPGHDTVSLSIEDSDVLNNTAARRGGGIAASDTLRLTAVTIAGNAAPRGGGLWFGGTRGDAAIRASAVVDNQADEDGGGIYYQGSSAVADRVFVTAVVDSSVIERNTATDRGGGIFHSGSKSALTVRNRSDIAGNAAAYGGGIFQTRASTGTTVIEGSTVRENTVRGSGGGITIEGGAIEIRAGSVVEHNAAVSDGGGIETRHAEPQVVVIIDESGIIANEAGGRGGGLFVSWGEITVNGTSCLIVGNVADADGNGFGSGGGIYHVAGDISGVPEERVCFNDPNDMAP